MRRAKGNLCKWLPNKEIQFTSYFSAVFANSAVNEKQSQFAGEAKPAQAIPKACGFESATQRWPVKKKGDLKKQSQFSKGRNNVKSILAMSYGDFDGPGRRENKANSKPILIVR